MKILIVGFPRSGTSLTNRIFNRHPQVSKMLFEKWLLKNVKNEKAVPQKHKKMINNCGEKVIWGKRTTGKNTSQTIVDYCHLWNDFFSDETRIVQLIRHPYDTLNSLVISKKRLPRGPAFERNYSEYLQFAPIYVKQISEIPNCLTIKYELLVSDLNNTTKVMYNHCKIDPTHKHPEKMKKGRIFNYKKKDFLFKYDDRLKHVIEVFNTIEGPKYEL
jgi:hypothetical protein